MPQKGRGTQWEYSDASGAAVIQVLMPRSSKGCTSPGCLDLWVGSRGSRSPNMRGYTIVLHSRSSIVSSTSFRKISDQCAVTHEKNGIEIVKIIRVLRSLFFIVVILVLAVATLWGALAMWFKLPFTEPVRLGFIGLFAVLGLITMARVATPRRTNSLAVFLAAFAALCIWWSAIDAPSDSNWSPDVAQQTTGEIDGDRMTLTNIREFEWRSNDDYTENWTTRTYDLSQLETLDLFLSYWGGPQMAHFILSFGFSDGTYLAWTVEVRRPVGGVYSPLADAFKTHTLVTLATVEQDVVGVRSNVRGEDVRLFRLNVPRERARMLLEGYVQDANRLAENAQWYNSLTTNCTTAVYRIIATLGGAVPVDWRLIANGFLPEMLYDEGVLNTDYTVQSLRDFGRIAERAQAAGLGPDFSARIREGVPAGR